MLPIKDSVSFELEERLQRNQGQGCQMVKYLFKRTDPGQWKFQKATTSVEDIKHMALYAPDHKDEAGAF